jgi:hypothetical protein
MAGHRTVGSRGPSYARPVVTNRGRWLLTLVVGAVVVAPAVLPDADDDFPISTYPMFTTERGEVVDLDTAVLVDDEGRHRLSPETIGGTDEIVAAAVTVSNAVAGGSAALDLLCQDIAERIDDDGEVEIVTERHDAVDLLRDGAPPISVTVHERCPA